MLKVFKLFPLHNLVARILVRLRHIDRRAILGEEQCSKETVSC